LTIQWSDLHRLNFKCPSLICPPTVQMLIFFEMNKRDLGRQRENRILVAEEEILHGIENQPQTSSRRVANHLELS
jgi:hypothetical protein